MSENLSLLTMTYAQVRDGDLDLFEALRITEGDLNTVSDWAKMRRLPDKDVRAAMKSWRLHKAFGARIRTPQQFAEAVIGKLGLRISFDGMISRTGSGLAAEYNLGNLIDDVISANYEHEAGYPESALKVEVSRWVQRSKDHALQAIGANIFDEAAPRCDEEWTAVADALAMPEAATTDYVVAVLQTLIWQVKRKMRGLEVTGHLMPILTGKQGNGKTTFLRNFLAPVADVATFVSFREALDSRNLGVWSSFVHVYDEMEKGELADVNAVKSAITGEKRSARVMGTNTTATVRQLATSVGAMNGKIGEVLRDPTGMRRYGPLPTGDVPGPDKPGVDWDVLNLIDYSALWRSVQVTEPRPVDRVADELQRLQDAERMLDPVEYYLRHHLRRENVVQSRKLRSTSAIAAADLHRDFSEMMKDHFAGHRPINVQSFGSKVTGYLSEAWCPLSHKEEAKEANFYHLREGLDSARDQRPADVVAITAAPRRAA